MPRKMRQLALRCVLSAKAGYGELKVVEDIKLDQPKTKEIAQILGALGADSSALIVTGEPEESVVRSARNLVGIKTIPASLLNVVDLLSYKVLLMTVAAVHKVEQLWGQRASRGGVNASV
jgi:large subunit ribosomal protein L4